MTFVEPLDDGMDFENDVFTTPSNPGIMTQNGVEDLMNLAMGQQRINEKSNSSFNFYTQDTSPLQHQKERQVINDELAEIFQGDCSWDFNGNSTEREYERRTGNAEEAASFTHNARRVTMTPSKATVDHKRPIINPYLHPSKKV